MRVDGNALLSAVRYEVEKVRCSACGQLFTAAVPAAAGTEKYTARARAVVALARYDLGLPWHRLEGFQALVGVPVPDATQWDQGEMVGDCSYPIFLQLEKEAAQGEVIFQDDTPQRPRNTARRCLLASVSRWSFFSVALRRSSTSRQCVSARSNFPCER